MVKITVGVEGMACGMCEAHVNDVIRKNFNVDSVSSSHSKKRTEIVAEQPLDEEQLRKVIAETGYEVKEISVEPCEKKKGFFSRLFG